MIVENLTAHLCRHCAEDASAVVPAGLTTFAAPGPADSAACAAPTPTGSSTTEIDSLRAQLTESQAEVATLRDRIEALETKMELLENTHPTVDPQAWWRAARR